MQVLQMPSAVYPHTVGEMRVGEAGYASPAALVMTRERTCWLQSDIAVKGARDRTASMHITRTLKGYVADITHCNYRWEAPSSTPYDALPVAQVVFGDGMLS